MAKAKKSADARKFGSFSGVCGTPEGKGTGSGGGKGYHASPKSKENISPPNARDHDSCSVKGGPKSTNEY